MSYTKEFIVSKTEEVMKAFNVNEENRTKFKDVIWEEGYDNMLSNTGAFFIHTFFGDIEHGIKIFESRLMVKDVNQLKEYCEKLDKQGFVFYLSHREFDSDENNLIIVEPEEDFKNKMAFFGGLEEWIKSI